MSTLDIIFLVKSIPQEKIPNDLVTRVIGEVDSILTTIIIINIILDKGKIWGYQLKQEIRLITGSEIQNSTLYTILRNLELKYAILESEMIDRRRFYWLTKPGIVVANSLIIQWFDMVKKSEKLLKKSNYESGV
jgi:DNA-binding PadR family transcriptional regulator